MSHHKPTPPTEWHLALPVRFGMDKGSGRVSLAVNRSSLHALMYFAALAHAAFGYLPEHHPGAGPATVTAVYGGCAVLALASATVVNRLTAGDRRPRDPDGRSAPGPDDREPIARREAPACPDRAALRPPAGPAAAAAFPDLPPNPDPSPEGAVALAVRLMTEAEDVARHADPAGLRYLAHRAGKLSGNLDYAARAGTS
ncbi:hypothetical protein AB0M43_14195 [Longispora sp. NPDC051575]|uniref:hypothetical protein n=1 Tax=Longispora sp. NPDC051575 TaxID=3154943 RepID=UPI00341C11CA